MPKVTKAHLEARRQQILDAAFACFSSAGFYQTTMQDVCTKAQLSPGAVYRYFAGKEEIIEAMVEQSREQSASLIEEAKGHGSTLQVLTNLADAFFSLLDQPAALATIRLQIELWEESLHNPHVMELLRRDFDSVRQTITEIVTRGQKEGDINPSLDPNAVARVLISFFDGLLVQKAMDREVDVWEYVAVVKAIGAGLLWQHDTVELGTRNEEQGPGSGSADRPGGSRGCPPNSCPVSEGQGMTADRLHALRASPPQVGCRVDRIK